MSYHTKEEALHGFWSSFGWDAYDETDVPDDAELPYITYNVMTDNIGTPIFPTASLWSRSTSWKTNTQKAVDIARSLSYGGSTIPFDGGVMFITQGAPFTQRMGEDDDGIRRTLLNVAVEFLCAD